jgi:hypothetical protein
VQRLEDELERARDLAVADLADAIETIGFECTRCGACCKGYEPEETGEGAAGDPDREDHTATVFPDETRRIRDGLNETRDDGREYDWRDVARPTPYGLRDGADGPEGETFEWALAVDDCGDCTFYEPDDGDGGTCSVYGDRPLVCRTYPFSVALGGVDEPMGEVVEEAGAVRAHECEGLGREISRGEAESLAATLKERAVREIEEAIAVRDQYEPVDREAVGERVVVHDSEGAKRADGTPLSADAERDA